MSDVAKGQWFAWERGVRGPTPVKFHAGIPASDAGRLLARHAITADQLQLSFNQLAQRYPAPPPGPDDLWRPVKAAQD